MKVPFHVVKARRERLAQLLGEHRYLPVKELCRRLGVSEATARRDLAALAQEKKIKRTFGGALSEFNERYPSFRERQGRASRSKSRIGAAALQFIEPGQTCFLDSGTTICALAEAFREKPIKPLTVVTSNLPIAETLAAIPGLQVFLVAGQLLHLQSTLLGEVARRSLEFWNFDLAFLSAEGMNAAGLWNSQEAIIEQQRVVLQRSRRSIFCVDGSKLDGKSAHFLLPWTDVDLLLTDLAYERLVRAGIDLPEDRYCPATGLKAGKAGFRRGVEDTDSGEETFPVHIL